MSLVGTLKQPAYTGSNRCLPCTVVNAVLAVALAGTLAVLVAQVATPTVALLVAAALLGVSAGSIYFRGYLIPGTPELTKQYLPARVLAAFGKDVPGASQPAAEPDESFDVESELRAAGAIEPCAGEDDLCLTESFGAAWRSATGQVETDRERLVSVLGLDAATVEFVEHGDAFRAVVDGRDIGRWESEAAFRADLASAAVFETECDRWPSLSVGQRGQLLNGVRLFLEVCPACKGDLSFETDTVESCCYSREVAAVTCDGCSARLFEADLA